MEEEMRDRPFTPGEIAVGLNNDKVNQLKKLFAAAYDIVEKGIPLDDGEPSITRKRKMGEAALHEIITAQMWAVKVVTLR